MYTDIEDGMGFAGLVPTRQEREGEREHSELRGMVNVLADELARYTGRTVPDEIKTARERVRKGRD